MRMKQRTLASRRSEKMVESGIRKIFDRALRLEQAGQKIVHLEIGRPDWDSPAPVKAAACAALERGQVHYIPNRGVPELRRKIAAKLKTSRAVDYDPETEIIVTNGASEAVAMTALALLDRGDEAIVQMPAWPHYYNCILMAGAKPVPLNCGLRQDFVIDPDELKKKITARTKLFYLHSPANPTGAVQPREVVTEIAKLCERRGIVLVSDEIYEDYFYGTSYTAPSAVADKENCILINGLSKAFSMTGWRIGYAASGAKLSRLLNKMHQYLTVCGNSFAQAGAVAAFTDEAGEFNRKIVAEFARRKQLVEQALSANPAFRLYRADGAFYLFPEIRYQGMDSFALAEHMLTQAGVAAVPGEEFGRAYKRHVRLSYACSQADLAEGMRRLAAAFS